MPALMDEDDDQPLAKPMEFGCQSCGKHFRVSRDEWKAKHGKLRCPNCDKSHDYGQRDDLSPPPGVSSLPL
jgi:predicted Zn finger-like uncharacterized protein